MKTEQSHTQGGGTMELFQEVSFPTVLRDIPHPILPGERIPGRKAVLRTDTNEVLNIVSDRYPLVPHIEVFGAMEEAVALLGIPVLKREVRSANSGGYAKVVWTLDKSLVVGDGIEDNSKFTIQARNSYNYSSLVGMELGLFRLICSNGMMIGRMLARNQKRHVPSLQVPVLLREITAMLEKTTDLEARFQRWAAIEYSAQRLGQWLEGTQISRSGRTEVLSYYTTQPDRVAKGGKPEYNGWESFNALTWFATHRVKSRSEDSKLIASERVLDLAQSFSLSELEGSISRRKN